MFDQNQQEELSPTEVMIQLKVWIALAIFAVASAGTLWLTGVNWLVAHSILVAASGHPVLTLPYAEGAGFDIGRLTILACIVAALLAIAISSLHHSIQRRRYR